MADYLRVECTGLDKAGIVIDTGGVFVERVGPGVSASGTEVMPDNPAITSASCRVTRAWTK